MWFFAVAWMGHTPASREMADDIIAAFRVAQLSHKAAAIAMGLDEGDLSRQLAGKDPLSVYRLGFLPVEFHTAWLQLRAERIGGALLTADQLSIIKGASVLGLKRMLRILPADSASTAKERLVS